MTPQRSLFDSLPLEWRRAAAYRASLEHLGYDLESMALVVTPPGSQTIRGQAPIPSGKRGLCVRLEAEGKEFNVLAAIIEDLDPREAATINNLLVLSWNALSQEERGDVRKTLVDADAFSGLALELVAGGFRPPALVAKGLGRP